MSSNQGNTGGNNVGNTMNAMQKQQVQQQQPQQQFRPITSPIGINPQSGPAPQQGPPAGTTTSLPPISQGFNTHAPYFHPSFPPPPPGTAPMVSGAPPNPTAFQGSQGSQPLPQPTGTLPQGAAAAAGNAYRPLNVRDALTYLDQVKLQFQDEPEVYNKFLDIMKDFKSQAIDTPGVIERVSQLFRGHPQLIIGFNTFLPPGYRIDISNDRRTYTITTPHDGSYSSGAALPGVGGGNVRDARSNSVSGPPVQMVPGTAGPSSVSNSIQHALQAGGQHQIHAANPQQSLAAYEGHTGHQAAFMQQPVASNTNSATSSAALQQGAFGAASTAPAPIQSNMHAIKKPVEFNHAINYVNKIKNRFASDPETYKQFLEILRNYQNEVKPIGEVYSMIQQLFKGHPDLLDEFKHFLPDYNAPTNMPAPPQQTQRRQSISSGAVAGQKRKYAQAPAAVSNGAVTVQDKALRKAVPQIVRQRPNRYQPGGRWNVTEEFEFFERVKKHLANKTTYTEFLKVLNLFNQDIIDSKMLVERVEPFIGRNYELFEWFKRYVKFDADTAVDAEEYTYGGSRNQSSINHTNLFKVIADSKRSGSSYRLLPSNYVQPKSTGRDDLAVEVLNDQWVCHPTWASEDGGFIAHKKNQFEDALFRCEEERYEFDLNIEINRSVIQRLEAIWRKIEALEDIDSKKAFKLDDGLGDGMSKSSYKQILKKIYDDERGREVIECLHEHPYLTIPVVLKRLKQKDEEWRRSQREWNKVWREIDGKNFYKSLDHQGINFKNVDKKYLSSKSLIQEIEAIYRSKLENQSAGSNNEGHISVVINDEAIVQAVIRLIISYLDKNSQFKEDEIEQVDRFLHKFLLNEFMLEQDASKDCAVLYGNNSFYLFFRLFEIAYSRLRKVSEILQNATKLRNDSANRENEVAKNLDLINREDAPAISPNSSNPLPTFDDTLVFLEKMFSGELDVQVYEDQLRFWFGTEAYPLFTVDKLIHSLSKQLLTITNEPSAQKLYQLFAKNFSVGFPQYKQKADELVDESENLYRMQYRAMTKDLVIDLLGTSSEMPGVESGVLGVSSASNTLGVAPTLNTNELKWSDYIDNYVKSSVSESQENYVSNPQEKVFMKRVIKNHGRWLDQKKDFDFRVESKNQLECKICVNTFKMFYVQDCEDYFRRVFAPPISKPSRSSEKSVSKWHKIVGSTSEINIKNFFLNAETPRTVHEKRKPFRTTPWKDNNVLTRYATEWH